MDGRTFTDRKKLTNYNKLIGGNNNTRCTGSGKIIYKIHHGVWISRFPISRLLDYKLLRFVRFIDRRLKPVHRVLLFPPSIC